MKSAVLYPFKREDISYLLSQEKIYHDYTISDVVAPRGSGLCGKDISHADCRDKLGMLVKENLDECLKNVDALLITSGGDKLYNADIEEVIEKALTYKKDIICNVRLGHSLQKEIRQSCRQSGKTFIYGLEEKIRWQETFAKEWHQMKTPVVFVTSILADANNMELMIKVKQELCRQGYKVTVVGVKPELQMYGGIYSGVMDALARGNLVENSVPTTIKFLNHFFKCVEIQETPDLIMVDVPGGLIETPRFPNESGVFAYLLTRAVQADYAIGTALYGTYTQDALEQISEEINKRFGFQLDCVHISNKMLHLSSSLQKGKMEFLYLPYDEIYVGGRSQGGMLINNFLKQDKIRTIAEDIIRVLGE